jgi:uncharacterized membrane protein
MTNPAPHDLTLAARRYFNKAPDALSENQRRVLDRAARRQTLTGDVETAPESMSFGQRLADRVAAVGGSWSFIIGFGLVLSGWIALNLLLATRAFDPYPFIFLNLMLSTLAAIQAPVIMMSQNRQAVKDRQAAAHDYEVNLKAEIEILALHDKLDQMRGQDLRDLLAKQNEQIEMLTRLVKAMPGRA